MNDKEVLELCKAWFEEIAEKSARLTTGNVSHLGRIIHGFAMNYAEFVESHLADRAISELAEETQQYVDLGLPSGTLWAAENEKGYFTFDEANEKFGDMLPSKDDFKELCRYCTCEWNNERKGVLFTAPNRKTLFFPAAGYRSKYNGYMSNIGSNGYYWSKSYNSTRSFSFNFSDSDISADKTTYRADGIPVRLIIKK